MPNLTTIQPTDIVANSITTLNNNFSSLNSVFTGQKVFNVLDYNATGDGTTDDTLAIRNAIYAQQAAGGGTVFFPPGTYYLNTNGGLVACPNGNTDATRPCILRGAGMQSTVLKMGPNAIGGIFNYSIPGGGFPKIAQITCSDLTLDGNYVGVSSGAIAQPTVTGGQLVTLPPPYTSASTPSLNGLFHLFDRVRFYRPSGYGTQSATAIIRNCVYDSCGQPDVAPGGLHWDNNGSGGDCEMIIQECSWINSSGNYLDMISFTTGHPFRCTFIANASRNHQIGGVYACGNSSIIMGNSLQNNVVGSGIGYDSGTHVSNRFNNIVTGNTCPNLNVGTSGLSTVYGDRVYGNVALDGPGGDIFPLGTGNSAPIDANLKTSSLSFYIDEIGNNLKARIKYSNGTLKTATVTLT